jgi:hypothetical protein
MAMARFASADSNFLMNSPDWATGSPARSSLSTHSEDLPYRYKDLQLGEYVYFVEHNRTPLGSDKTSVVEVFWARSMQNQLGRDSADSSRARNAFIIALIPTKLP